MLVRAPAPPEPPPSTVVLAAPQSAASQPAAPEADPQLIEVFIEEAREESSHPSSAYSRCGSAIRRDQESLATMRRNFHTLKGSGRMVGARQIGDFAWSIENLLIACSTIPCRVPPA